MFKSKYRRKFFDHRYIPHEKRQLQVMACIFFGSLLLAVLTKDYVLGAVQIQGQSMYPTLQNNERHLFHRWPYLFNDPERNQLVVFKDPRDGTQEVKRVIGMPGETAQIRDGHVFLNGKQVSEPYIAEAFTESPRFAREELTIPAGHYFLLGDNRGASYDSRHVGTVKRRLILGRIFES